MTKQRVLVLNQFALPMSRGGGTRHVELFGKLDAWDAMVVAGDKHYFDQEPVAEEGILRTVRVTRYEGNGVGRVINWCSYSVGALLAGVRHRRTSIVYGSSPHLGAALAGLIVARLKRVPFVLEIRDLWPQILAEAGTLSETSRVYRILKWLEGFLYRQADRIVVLAEGSQRALEKQGVPNDKILFIPNGGDPEDFEVSESRDALRKRFGFDRFTLVYAGAHGPANGLGLVLDAAESLQAGAVDVEFVLVGDGVSKQALVDDASSRQIRNVRFVAPIPKADVPSLLAAADVGLHCLADVELFKTGVSPNKLYDYMAAGLPVLTNTGGDIAAMVNNAGSGVAVGSEAIAEGVAQIAELGESALVAFGKAGRSFMAAERSRTAMAQRLEALLDGLA